VEPNVAEHAQQFAHSAVAGSVVISCNINISPAAAVARVYWNIQQLVANERVLTDARTTPWQDVRLSVCLSHASIESKRL